MARFAWGAILLCLSLLSYLPVAHAQTDAELVLARKWFANGSRLEKQAKWREARQEFRRVLEVKESPQVYLHIGLCSEKLGELADALIAYQQALRIADQAGGKVGNVTRVAKERLEALEPRVPELSVTLPDNVNDDDVAISLDGDVLALASIRNGLPVNPGTHTLRVEAAGHEPFEREFELGESDSKTVAVSLVPLREEPQPADDLPEATAEPDGVSGMFVGGITTVAIGAVALAVGIPLVVVAFVGDDEIDALCGGPDRDACPLDQRDAIDADHRQTNTLRIVGFAVGGVGIAAAIAGIAMIVAGSGDDTDQSSWRARPLSVRGAHGASLVVPF